MADDNNQVAPATPADNATATIDSPDAAGTEGQENNTTQSSPPEPAFDPKTSYESLVKELQSVNKNYGNLRSEFTRRTQYEAQLKQQIEALHKAFAEATKQEISPEEFMKSLQTQGIKAFDPLREQWKQEWQEEHNKALNERDSKISKLEVNAAIMARSLDTENYPDFVKLKPVMQEIASAENSPVDWSADVDVIYDTLYKLARDLKAEDSIKSAHKLGRQEAEAQAAKEAGTTVAAGGKTNTSGLDPRKMSAADLKKHFAKLGMVSD